MTRHPLTPILTRAGQAGDALRSLVLIEANGEVSEQDRLTLAVALDAMQRAAAPLRRCSDRTVQASAGRLVAALDLDTEPSPGSP